MKDYKTKYDRLGDSFKPFPDEREPMFSFDYDWVDLFIVIPFAGFIAGILTALIW